jgi:hypothetical protein
MDEPLSAYQAPQGISAVGAEWLAQEVGIRRRYGVERNRAKEIPVIAIEHPVRGLAQVCGLVEHCIEHRREIAGRGIDDLQNLSGRGLPFQRRVTLGLALGKFSLTLGKLTLQIGYELFGIG